MNAFNKDDIIEDEVKVELNWIFKTFFYFGFYAVVMHFIENHDNKWLMGGACAIVCFIIPLCSMKFTSKGCYGGINCYFFSFYRNKLIPWEKYTALEIDNLWFTSAISLRVNMIILRFMFFNFDKLAELISRNTLIAPEIRQPFVDYVNIRKQQGIIYRIRHTILVIAILCGIITLIYAIAKP